MSDTKNFLKDLPPLGGILDAHLSFIDPLSDGAMPLSSLPFPVGAPRQGHSLGDSFPELAELASCAELVSGAEFEFVLNALDNPVDVTITTMTTMTTLVTTRVKVHSNERTTPGCNISGCKRPNCDDKCAKNRQNKIARFMKKRPTRVWKKKIMLETRQYFANSRLRVKGRFIKKEDEELLRNLLNTT